MAQCKAGEVWNQKTKSCVKKVNKTLRGTPEEGQRITKKKGVYKTQKVHSISADQVGSGSGKRFYSGEGSSRSMSMSGQKASFDARVKMASTPSDSIRFKDVPYYLKKGKIKKKRKGFFKK
jgi:predicted ATP-dependent Lon-type protease